jgi:hypothetical protein
MRKLIVPTAILGALAIAGVSGAAPRSAEITLAAVKPEIVFGQATNLSGKLLILPSVAPQVQILAVPLNDPQRQAQVAFTLAADEQGSFGTVIQPLVGTRYAAVYTTLDNHVLTSSPITVGVRPKVTLTWRGRVGQVFTFATTVMSEYHNRGHKIALQRRSATGWYTLKQVRLVSDTTPTAYKVHLANGRNTVRAIIDGHNAGRGYLAGISTELSFG